MRARYRLVAVVLVAGCGGDDISGEREQFGDRIDEVLADLERQFEPPRRTSPTVRARGRTGTTTIDAFLTDILRDVDAHWTRVFAAANLPEHRRGLGRGPRRRRLRCRKRAAPRHDPGAPQRARVRVRERRPRRLPALPASDLSPHAGRGSPIQ